MIQGYKILHNIDRIDSDKFFTQAHYKGTRGHSKNLYKLKCKADLRKNAFSSRTLYDWNSLTEDIVSADSIDTFKFKMDKFWKTQWLIHHSTFIFFFFRASQDFRPLACVLMLLLLMMMMMMITFLKSHIFAIFPQKLVFNIFILFR
jgi:hypothetical protein